MLKRQYFGHLRQRTDSLDKALMLGKIEGRRRRRGRQRMRWLDGITDLMDMSLRSFSFSIIPSKEIPGLISFRMDSLDLLVVHTGLVSNFLVRPATS